MALRCPSPYELTSLAYPLRQRSVGLNSSGVTAPTGTVGTEESTPLTDPLVGRPPIDEHAIEANGSALADKGRPDVIGTGTNGSSRVKCLCPSPKRLGYF